MSENPLAMTKLNDFIFCPASIYFHSLDEDTDRLTYQDEYQINGSSAHAAPDNGLYSSKKNVLQSLAVYSEKYNLFGKIDIYDADKGLLTERKKKIKTIYDGYIFQIYAQYFALMEMGYDVKALQLYSMDDNKKYPLEKPEDNPEMLAKFENLIKEIDEFSFSKFRQDNIQKCTKCIYEPLCIFSELKGQDDYCT